MSFRVPAMDAVSDTGVCAEGRHHVTATNFEAAKSQASGRDMMNIEFTVDTGDQAGHTLVERVVFGTKNMFGERKLKQFCVSAGYRWREKDSVEAFVAQFPKNTLRAEVVVKWRYSVKKDVEIAPGTFQEKWVTVDKEEYEDFDGQRSIQAEIVDYSEPVTNPDLVFGTAERTVTDEDDSAEPDEELPF